MKVLILHDDASLRRKLIDGVTPAVTGTNVGFLHTADVAKAIRLLQRYSVVVFVGDGRNSAHVGVAELLTPQLVVPGTALRRVILVDYPEDSLLGVHTTFASDDVRSLVDAIVVGIADLLDPPSHEDDENGI